MSESAASAACRMLQMLFQVRMVSVRIVQSGCDDPGFVSKTHSGYRGVSDQSTRLWSLLDFYAIMLVYGVLAHLLQSEHAGHTLHGQ